MRRTTKLAHPRRLGLLLFRGAWQRLSMTLLVMMLIATTAWAEIVNISYVKADGTTGNVDATVLNGSDEYTAIYQEEGYDGWYVVTGKVTYSAGLYIEGHNDDVNLILCDGAEMSLSGYEYAFHVSGYHFNIYGQTNGTGKVVATNNSDDGSGIYASVCSGDGYSSLLPGSFTIYGGVIEATGGDYGISTYGDLIINNGSVTATGDYYYGIYAGSGITISGGTVSGTGGMSTYEGDITISGGKVTVTGNDICTLDGYIYLGWTNITDYITIKGVSAASTMVVDGKALVDNSGKIFSGNVSNPGDLGDVTLQPVTAVNLVDNADNATAIGKLNGVIDIDVTLQNRTLSKSGEWNTLCLPFSMTATQIAASDLAGATIKEMDCSAKGTELNNGTLTLKFTTAYDPTDAPDGSIVAGKPYIVKWNTTGDNISNPVFTGVTISSTAPTAVKSYDQKVTFVGQYSPFKIGDVSNGDDGNLNEILMLGSGSALGYSKNARELKCFRAHFYVPADGGSAGARAFVVDFGDEETTAIVSMEDGRRNTEDVNDIWYTLDGRRFDGKPTKKGVYIVNGKKIVIK